MEKRKFILLALIVLSAVVIGLIIYFLVFYTYSRQPSTTVTTATPEVVAVPKITNTQPGAAPTTGSEPAVDLAQEDAGQVAKIFTERYGTYSNQGGAQQFADLDLFVTAKMRIWLAANTKEILAGLVSYQTSYIMTTQAVSVKTLSLTGSQASVLVSTRRSEQTGDGALKVTNKDIKIELIKTGGRWKVDAAFWQ